LLLKDPVFEKINESLKKENEKYSEEEFYEGLKPLKCLARKGGVVKDENIKYFFEKVYKQTAEDDILIKKEELVGLNDQEKVGYYFCKKNPDCHRYKLIEEGDVKTKLSRIITRKQFRNLRGLAQRRNNDKLNSEEKLKTIKRSLTDDYFFLEHTYLPEDKKRKIKRYPYAELYYKKLKNFVDWPRYDYLKAKTLGYESKLANYELRNQSKKINKFETSESVEHRIKELKKLLHLKHYKNQVISEEDMGNLFGNDSSDY
jgi:hypothetical protein